MLDPKRLRFHRPSRFRGVRLTHWVLGAALAVALVVQTTSASVPAKDVRTVASPTGCAVNSLLVPTCGKTLAGVYARPSGSQSYPQAIRSFETLTGSPTQIVHYFYSGNRQFPNAAERTSLTADGAQRLLLANWKVDAGYTWAQVAAGRADARIRSEANYLKANFNTNFFLTIHHEPENEVNQTAGSGHTAKDYAAMQRHVISVLRANGATNFVPVLNLMGSQKWVTTSWFKDLYPGDSYVGWIGFAAYATKNLGVQDGGFREMMNRHWGSGTYKGMYHWATTTHPGKPLMLTEWGVQEKSGYSSWKQQFFQSAGSNMNDFPALKALVYFNNYNAFKAGDVRANTTSASLSGYKAMLRSFYAAS